MRNILIGVILGAVLAGLFRPVAPINATFQTGEPMPILPFK
jgi:hypothetical protein